MFISNNPVFLDLIPQNPPSIVYTEFDPVANWSRPELLALAAGSVVIHIGSGGCGGECYNVCMYLKVKQTSVDPCPPTVSGAGDYRRCCCSIGYGGTTPPDGDSPTLCTAPLESIYVQRDEDDVLVALWIKIANNCLDSDWVKLGITLTRTGTVVSYNPATGVLNLPIGGNLVYDGTVGPNGEQRYTWVPDDGTSGFFIFMTLNNTLTKVMDLNGPTLNTSTQVLNLPEVIAGHRRYNRIASGAFVLPTGVVTAPPQINTIMLDTTAATATPMCPVGQQYVEIPVTGRYLVEARGLFDVNGAEYNAGVQLNLNGSQIQFTTTQIPAAIPAPLSAIVVAVHFTGQFTAGDHVNMSMWQDSGGNVNTGSFDVLATKVK